MKRKVRTTTLRAMLGMVAIGILGASSCNRDADGPTANPSISFVTDSGYTYLNDTLSLSDTLLVGVIIQEGGQPLRTFKVQATYGLLQPITVDSLPVGTEVFEFDKTIVLRDIPGTEKWTFLVVQNDGDVIKRSLTFVVQ